MSVAELELERELDTETPPTAPVSIADRYKLAVINAASTGRLEIDEKLLHATGRFQLDFRNDVAKMRSRFEAAEAIAAADAELRRLAENPPQPRPAADWTLDRFATLGELSLAVSVMQNPKAIWGPDWEHHETLQAAKASKARGVNTLRFSADPNLQSEAGQLSNSIARHREAIAKHSQLVAELASLEKKVAGGYHTEEQRDIWHRHRGALAKLRVRVADPPTSLDEAEVRRKIEALAAKQLLPLSVSFQPPQPAGPPAGAGSW